MGSLGIYRLGLLYPDLWARAFGFGNYTNPFCVTPTQSEPNYCHVAWAPFNYFSLLDNARNLPFAVHNGWADYLTPITGSYEITSRLRDLGYAYRFWQYPTRSHEADLVGFAAQALHQFLGASRRVGDPAHVTYLIDRTMDDPAWHLQHDRAYWVSEIRLAAGVQSGSVDAWSGRGTSYTTSAVPMSSGESPGGPFLLNGQDPVWRTLRGPNQIRLVLRGISSVRIDPKATGLSLQRMLTLSVDSDAGVRLVVVGWPDVLRVGAGLHTLRLGPRR